MQNYKMRGSAMHSGSILRFPPFFQVGGNWQAATLRLLESQGQSRVRRTVEWGQDERVRSTAGGIWIPHPIFGLRQTCKLADMAPLGPCLHTFFWSLKEGLITGCKGTKTT